MLNAAPAQPEVAVPSSGLTPHPLRDFALKEMLARPFTPLPTPCRMLHFAYLPEGEARMNDRRALRGICRQRGLPEPPSGAKFHRVDFGDFVLRWEGHSEFTTYTFEISAPGPAQPFQPAATGFMSFVRLFPQPGPLLVMADLHILPAESEAEVLKALSGSDLAFVETGGGKLVSAFAPDGDGFVRIAILDRAQQPEPTGALAQRVLEIETYRTLTLLGLPLALELGPKIRAIELQLPSLKEGMRSSASLESNREMLDRLTALAAELETDAASSSFRFGATRAYGELVRLRLDAIGETAIAGQTTWSSFLNRRLNPAIHTCATTEVRQDQLSRKLARTAQLLRTRVEIDLETQNSEVLHAMNDRARLQLRLQQTVEGLSIAAISYYIASLAHHVFEGLHAAGWHLDPLVATAATVPVAIGVVGYVVWRIRHHHTEKH